MADVLKRLGRDDEASALRDKFGGAGNFDFDLPNDALYDEAEEARIAASKAYDDAEEAKDQARRDLEKGKAPAQDLRTYCASSARVTEQAKHLAVSQGLNVPRPTIAEVEEGFKRSAGSVSPGVSLKTLEDLVVHVEKKGLAVDVLSWREVYDHVIVPHNTSRGESCSCLKDNPRAPHHFYVSHSWSVNFRSTVELIIDSAAAMMPGVNLSDIFVWVDALCRQTHDASGAPLPPSSLVIDTQVGGTLLHAYRDGMTPD
jgi:hypothetical protein